MTDAAIMELNLPTGIPIVYELDKDLKPVKPMQFLGDEETVRKAMEAVAAQGKVKKWKQTRIQRLNQLKTSASYPIPLILLNSTEFFNTETPLFQETWYLFLLGSSTKFLLIC